MKRETDRDYEMSKCHPSDSRSDDDDDAIMAVNCN